MKTVVFYGLPIGAGLFSWQTGMAPIDAALLWYLMQIGLIVGFVLGAAWAAPGEAEDPSSVAANSRWI